MENKFNENSNRDHHKENDGHSHALGHDKQKPKDVPVYPARSHSMTFRI